MARKKFRARPKGEEAPSSGIKAILERFGLPIAVAALLVTGIFVYLRVFTGPDPAYDRAIADCVADYTRAANTQDMRDAATAMCVHEHGTSQ